jgi:hypothetical protein
MMALMELTFTDQSQLKGRSFSCSTCTPEVKSRRRCAESRWDFTEKDDPRTFPIYVQEGGQLYGFCPAKATWDQSEAQLFRLLMISADTGAMMVQGGLEDQPDWWIDLLGWFLPTYDQVRFAMKARSVLGDGKPKNGNNNRKPQR